MGLLPALAMGVGAYGATELIFQKTKKDEPEKIKTTYEILNEAKQKNEQIQKMIPLIESEELKKNIKEISETVTKIISTVEKKTEKMKKCSSFFDYYLPVTVKILKKYDEIENQRLTSKDGKEFMESAKNMIQKINEAFKKQLSNLYQSDIIDTDAEMKIFETMLKSEGFSQDEDFKIERGGKNE